MDPIVTAACELLAREKAFVLATIVRHEGSTPRPAGTRMLITANKDIVGTIGGGLLEAETMGAAVQMNAQTPARFLTFDLTLQDAAEMEMICGGRVRVLLDRFHPSDANRALFCEWHKALAEGRRAALVSVVTGNETHIETVDHALLNDDTQVPDRLQFSAAAAGTLFSRVAEAGHVEVFDLEGRLVVVDPGRNLPTLYVFGAGHVARPTAHLAALVGFGVVVLDDRADFACAARFPDAAGIRVLKSFDEAFDGLAVDDNTYIVIVTRGHLHDREVLAQALKTPAAYIGMIGSRRKRDAIYESLLHSGFTADDLSRVHSPIGLPIGGDTPEEIAVSIAAELIAVRSGENP